MPSSTSSSEAGEHRTERWALCWVLALVMAVAAAWAIEAFWRDRGHRPGVVSDRDLWALHRGTLEGADTDDIVLLGGSRIELGFIEAAFHADHPGYRTVQLAIAGRGPYAVLRDLAADETFAGTVLCSITARALQPERRDDQAAWVDHYHTKWSALRRPEVWVDAQLRGRLALLQSHLAIRPLLLSLRRGRWPGVNYVVARPDRRRVADFERMQVDMQRIITGRLAKIRGRLVDEPPPEPAAWAELVAEVAGFVDAIEDRGGRVAFVRFPIRGEFARLMRESYPRERYWDVFAANVGAVCLHDAELEGTDAMRCPDESHLAYDDAVRFTQLIGRELQTRGVLAR
ncbi:MAG: hypothetical protein AAF628_12005 [Planctomycetota bacterium]